MKKKIAYIIFIVILFLLFIWTNKLQTLWLFGMFGIIWLPMFFINRYNAGKIAVKFDIINELKEDPALLLEIENSSFFPVSKIRIEFNCENVVFETEFPTYIECSAARKSREKYQFPIESKYCGQINVEIYKIYIYDYFGLTKAEIRSHKDCMFYQYPKERSMDLYDVEGSLVSENDVNYKHVKGNDISEILQIKEYMKGDSIKNIHWKMSAKMGKTMVKELDTPNDNSVMIFFDYAPKEDRNTNQKLIEALASVSHELIRLSTGHTIYHMDTKENRVVHRGVFELTEYDVMLQEVLETVADKSEYRVLDYILERGIIHRFAKVIFITYDANRDAAFEIERLEKGIVLYV